MDGNDRLAEGFEAHRAHLRTVAYRILGSPSEADDAVQEAWLRASRSGADGVDNLVGWLTTIVARVCLNMLRSRVSRPEDPAAEDVSEAGPAGDPEQQALLSDSIGLALRVVIDTLSPAERLAFVLHDMFDVPFDQVAPIVERSPEATRQLASRARRRVRGARASEAPPPPDHRKVVAAFLSAAQEGDFEALLTVLAPEVVLRADRAAVKMGADERVSGAAAVAATFSGRAQAARLALVDGVPGAVAFAGDRPFVVMSFTITDGRITGIDLSAEPGDFVIDSV